MTVQEQLRPGKYKLTVEDYLRLAEAGAFGAARTELIGGEIIVMSPEYRPHAWVKDELHYRLRQTLEMLGSGLHVSTGSVHLSDTDMPLPDIVLTAAPRGNGAIPLRSVALLVEVSSTTLRHDLKTKAPAYADAAIPEYWVVDVERRAIHQLWRPDRGRYAERREVRFGDPIMAATIEGLTVETAGI